MARVTRLRELPAGRVAVELDGGPWRTLPLSAVVRAQLTTGLELDRERLRTLRRELRRSEALDRAGRALAARDMSRHAVAAKLERAGFTERERGDALTTLAAAGAVDDERYARARAAALASRGQGNAAIRWDLEQKGLDADLAERAVAELASETARAAAIVARRGPSAATARFLARRGFGEEAIEAVVAEAASAHPPGAIG